VLRLKLFYRVLARAGDLGSYDVSAICLAMFFVGVSLTLCLGQLPHLNWIILPFLLALIVVFSRNNYGLQILFFCLFGFSWACYHFNAFSNKSFPDHYERTDFVVLGSIVGLPASKSGNLQFRFKVDVVEDSGLSILNGRVVQLSCYRCPLSIRAGERWRLTLRVKQPHGYASWGAFDYEKYLYRHQVVAKGYIRLKAENHRIGRESGSIHRLRESMLENFYSLYGSGVGANIIAALTLGVKSGFDNQQQQVFQTTGVSHLMAISGLHVGLVFIAVCSLLKWLLWPIARIFEGIPRQTIVLIPALTVACLYAALAGFSVSTQRALVMLVVYVVCKFVARSANLVKVLLIAITIILLIDPFSILDIGFWLSCGAVAVIAFFTTAQQTRSLIGLQPKLWLGMLPLSVLFFGQVSIVSPFVNLIAVPLFCLLLIPATLLSASLLELGLTGIGGWCLKQLNYVFEIIFHLLELVAQLELAKIYTTPLQWWQWLLFVFLLCAYFLKRHSVRRLIVVLFVASIFIMPAQKLDNDELQITLLDVGQGLAMVIETPNTVTVYDTGPRYGTGFTAAQAVLVPFLHQRGIRTIDTLVISHADNDHIGGLEAVRRSFEVKKTISSRLDKVSSASECVAGDSWRYEQTSFVVLSPQPETPKGSNNHSCVIMLEHLGTKILLSGDIEKQVEHFLVKNSQPFLQADILLVPHQGSKTSSTANFLDAVSPKLAILAAGYKNHYGHPHADVMRRYHQRSIEVLSTIDSGSVLLKINSQGWRKVLYREQERRFWRHQKLPNNGV